MAWRVFAVSGALGVALFDGEDPFAQHRPLDDKRCTCWIISQTKSPKGLRKPCKPQNKAAGAAQRAFFSRVYGEAQCRTGGENEGVDHKVIDAFLPDKRVALNGCNYVNLSAISDGRLNLCRKYISNRFIQHRECRTGNAGETAANL